MRLPHLRAESWQDAKHACRILGKRRALTTAVLVILALGIGAAIAAFSVIDALLIRQIGYRDSDRVYLVWTASAGRGAGLRAFPSQCAVIAWRASARTVAAFARYSAGSGILGETTPIAVSIARIEPDFLAFADITPLLGRGFASTDAAPRNEHVAIIGERLWRHKFDRTAAVLGRRIRVNDTTYTVVGVVGQGARLPIVSAVETELWLPLTDTAASAYTLARLRSGPTKVQAEAELDHIVERTGCGKLNEGSQTELQRPAAALGSVGHDVTVFAVGSGALLALACLNVAGLLVAFAREREREFAIRRALGASGSRIARQLVIETSIPVCGGAALGVAVGAVSLRLLVRARPSALEAIERGSVDRTVIAAASGLAIVAALALGLAAFWGSAFHARGRSPAVRSLSSLGARSVRGSRSRFALAALQTSLSMLLLIAAVILMRTVVALDRVDPGFDATDLFALTLRLPPARYQSAESGALVVDQTLSRIRQVPGVRAATLAGSVPPLTSAVGLPLEVEADGAVLRDRGSPFTATVLVGEGFFSTLGISFLQGSPFKPGARLRHEIIINSVLAGRLWPHENAIGRKLRFALGPGTAPDPWSTVVGVTRDVMTRSLAGVGTDGLIYYPSDAGRVVVIRTSGRKQTIAVVRQVAMNGIPGLGPMLIEDVAERVDATIALPRFMMGLVSVLAGISLVLATTSLHALLADSVARRWIEIGIRMAVGASPERIASAVLMDVLKPTSLGIATGLVGAVWVGRLLRSLTFGVRNIDPLSYAIAAMVLVASAILAAILPAYRAATMNPAAAMRAPE